MRAGGNSILSKFDDVSSSDVVIDCGGYHGDWTEEMLKLYGCQVYVFEPVPDIFQHLSQKFEKNERVFLKRKGIGCEDKTVKISLLDNASSLFKSSQDGVDIDIIDVAAFLNKSEQGVACLKLNIEGSEYEVLERMAECDLFHKVRNIVVQFHESVPDWEKRYAAIQNLLRKEYDCVWSYGKVWQRWQLKE